MVGVVVNLRVSEGAEGEHRMVQLLPAFIPG